MANQWLRLYAEFATDPKVQMMSEAMQRRYIMLMCLRCNGVVTLQDEEVAFQLRITMDELAETKAIFIKKGFIDKSWNLNNWDKRQFASDTSNARVAKHRELQKAKQTDTSNNDVTLQKQKSNVLDTDTDTDTDKPPLPQVGLRVVEQKPQYPPGFTKFWETWPTNDRKQARGKCFESWKKANAERDAALVIGHLEHLKNSEAWLKQGGQFVPAPLVYLNKRAWDGADILDEVPTALAGGF